MLRYTNAISKLYYCSYQITKWILNIDMKNKTRFNNCGLDSRLFPTLKFPTSYLLQKKKKGSPLVVGFLFLKSIYLSTFIG